MLLGWDFPVLDCVQNGSMCVRASKLLDTVMSEVVFLALLVEKIGFLHQHRTQLGNFCALGKYFYFAPLSQEISLSGILDGFFILVGV